MTQKVLDINIPVQSENTSITPLDMLNNAVSGGADLEVISKLMDLQERYEASQAKKAFVVAITDFKKNAPEVRRNKFNKQFKSYYASKSDLVNTVAPVLAEYGLTHRWGIDQKTAPGMVGIYCILTHELGHSEKAEMSAPADDSGAKNIIQQIKSTKTYLEVATFESVTGMASVDDPTDDDGNGFKQDEHINKTQIKAIEDALKANGKSKDQFIEWLVYKGLANDITIEQIPVTWFDLCITRINKKKVAV